MFNNFNWTSVYNERTQNACIKESTGYDTVIKSEHAMLGIFGLQPNKVNCVFRAKNLAEKFR